jgi:hypothetical protein
LIEERKNNCRALLMVDNIKTLLSTIAAALRFWNNEVLIETVYLLLMPSLRSTALTPSPSPACGRGEHGAQREVER